MLWACRNWFIVMSCVLNCVLTFYIRLFFLYYVRFIFGRPPNLIEISVIEFSFQSLYSHHNLFHFKN